MNKDEHSRDKILSAKKTSGQCFGRMFFYQGFVLMVDGCLEGVAIHLIKKIL